SYVGIELTPQLAINGNVRERRTSPAIARAIRGMYRDLDIRIDMGLCLPARLGHGPLVRVAYGLGIAPDGTGLIIMAPRLPGLAPRRHIAVADIDVENTLLRIDVDDIAVLDQADRPAHRRLGPDMADAKSARGARKTPIGDE